MPCFSLKSLSWCNIFLDFIPPRSFLSSSYSMLLLGCFAIRLYCVFACSRIRITPVSSAHFLLFVTVHDDDDDDDLIHVCFYDLVMIFTFDLNAYFWRFTSQFLLDRGSVLSPVVYITCTSTVLTGTRGELYFTNQVKPHCESGLTSEDSIYKILLGEIFCCCYGQF